jgi:hypothetical protein
MASNESGHWRIEVGFTDIEAIAYGGSAQDEVCAGEMYLTLAQLTAANDVRMRDGDEQDAGAR